MVQVDVFWAYGWGASLAAAAGSVEDLEIVGEPPLQVLDPGASAEVGVREAVQRGDLRAASLCEQRRLQVQSGHPPTVVRTCVRFKTRGVGLAR